MILTSDHEIFQESNDGSGPAEDDAVELAYEQHLRQLQHLHSSAGQLHQQKQQQRCKSKRKGKARSRQQNQGIGSTQQGAGVKPTRQAIEGGAAGEGSGAKRRRLDIGAAGPGAAGSVDTLASAAALAVPAAYPVQQQAQISLLSADPAAAAAAASQLATAAGAAAIPVLAWRPLAQGLPPAPGAAGAAAALALGWQPLALVPHVSQLVLAQPAAAAAAGATACGQVAGSAPQQTQQGQPPDASAVAAMVQQAMVQEEADSLAASAASKTAGICRLDLSAAALLISSHLAPQTEHPVLMPAACAGGNSGQGLPVELAVAGTAGAAGAEQGAEVEDATEAAAGGGQAALPAAAAASRRAQRRVYVHGNYHRYYGYRFFGTLPAGGQPGEDGAAASAPQPEDPRLAAFEGKWFSRRRCMDVGCNEGVVTLALVQRFCPHSMLGVDIDGVLVAKANRCGVNAVRQAAAPLAVP